MTNNLTLPTPVRAYLDLLQSRLNEQQEVYKTASSETVSVKPGKRFLKVVISSTFTPGSYLVSSHVHSFIEKATLDLYKAAGWNAPAKDARFNLVTDADLLTRVVDTYGSYLYKGR